MRAVSVSGAVPGATPSRRGGKGPHGAAQPGVGRRGPCRDEQEEHPALVLLLLVMAGLPERSNEALQGEGGLFRPESPFRLWSTTPLPRELREDSVRSVRMRERGSFDLRRFCGR